MTTRRFHLAWFTNFTQGGWDDPLAGDALSWDGKFYVELAQSLERACFDFVMFEDKLMVPETYGGSNALALKYGMHAPKHDPAPLAAMVGSATSHIGVVATLSTLSYPPFLLARLCATLDHISGGRFGWNIVTSGEDAAAQNFGLDKLHPREDRYAMADEYVELVRQLFGSWEDDAVVADREKRIYADGSKVHPVNFEGKYYKCRGPLNTVRPVQGRVAFVQAGGSPRGRAFAARHADAIVGVGKTVESMKFFRDDIRERARQAGRDPDEIKVFYLVRVTLGETDEEAWAKHRRMVSSPDFIERTLMAISIITEIDFSQFDLDAPLPPLATNGEQGSLDEFAQWGSGKTLRQLAQEAYGNPDSEIQFIGSPDTVADRMGDVIDAVGGDGFLIASPFLRDNRRFISAVTDGLVPALQRRSRVRSRYSRSTLRETLREF